FKIEQEIVKVQTACHPARDLIATEIQSERLKTGLMGINLRFPYPTGNHTDGASNWQSAEKHQSAIISENSNSAVFEHRLDSTAYFVKLNWTGKAEIIQKEQHYFVLQPSGESDNFSFSAEFSPENNFAEPVSFF